MGQSLSTEISNNLKRRGYKLEKLDNELFVIKGVVIDATGWLTTIQISSSSVSIMRHAIK